MTSEQKYPTLFSGFRVGSLELKNRIVHASMTTRFARDGKVSAKLKHYFSNRAKGGVSIIVSEPINGHRYQSDPRKLDVFNNRAARSLAATVNALAKFDCHLLGQLQDNGRGRREQGRNNAAIGVSALPDDLSWTVPHVMSTQEVYQLLEDFVLSCKNLKRSGLSGVEVSAGHGHLFHQFLSPWCNQRDDEFGGDLAGRTRFLGHLIQGIRDACGKDFLVGMKLPGADGITGSIDEAEAFAIAEVLGAKAIDYWTFAWGSHSHTLYHHLPDAFGERTPYAKAIGKLRQASPKIATGALGYLTDPNEAERLLVDGKADLIMLGRPLVTDPGWGVKAE
ncbi:MAG: oxidoreductase, partial [Pseudomonadota bacterium]